MNSDVPPMDEPILSLRKKINAAKNKLDRFEKGGIFSKFMAVIDLYQPCKNIIRKEFDGQIVTNAWMKMFEMLVFCEKHIQNGDTLTAFHNAELPGAFISATNHFIATKYPDMKYDWLASSYWPSSDNTALEDQFCMYQNYKDRWLMSPESELTSGDMTKKDTISYIAAKLRKIHPSGVDIYTSDAGMDIDGDYDNQEEKTLRLNFGQIICGLMCLKEGGTLITKQYTFFQGFTRSLIIAMAKYFDKFYIAKPHTSRPTNSEIYLIGCRYRVVPIEILKEWLDLIGNKGIFAPYDDLISTSLVDMNDHASKFSDKHIRSAMEKIYKHQQLPALLKSIEIMEKYKDEREFRKINMGKSREAIISWLEYVGMEPIPTFAKFDTC